VSIYWHCNALHHQLCEISITKLLVMIKPVTLPNSI
jgi:hypothetical protein